MNPSTTDHSSLRNAVVVSEFVTPALGTAPGPIRHELTIPHRMTSPYGRPAAIHQGVVGTTFATAAGSGQVITLKQLTPRQRPSILRRLTPGGEEGLVGMATTLTSPTASSSIVSIPTPVIVSTGHSSAVPTTLAGQQQSLRPEMQTLSGVDGTYVPRLGSLPKIPGASLRKQTDSSSDSSFPPAFTIVLGGIPPELVNRLFSSTNPNTVRVFSAPPNNNNSITHNQFSPKAAAVIAAPLRQSAAGSLFTDLQNGSGSGAGGGVGDVLGGRQVVVGGMNIVHAQPLQAVVSLSSGMTGLQEVDESSAAVAELASEQHSMVTNESFEDLEDSIQITSA